MKKLILFIFLLISVAKVKAQVTEVPVNETTIYLAVQIPPAFPGGIDKFNQYIADNIKAQDAHGEVAITFVIEKDGSLSDIKVIRRLSEATDAEAIRLIKRSPKWIPGKQGGKPVRVQYTVGVGFKA